MATWPADKGGIAEILGLCFQRAAHMGRYEKSNSTIGAPLPVFNRFGRRDRRDGGATRIGVERTDGAFAILFYELALASLIARSQCNRRTLALTAPKSNLAAA